MPVTTSYPGIYIEELPSNAHSVTAAPTSITVFVGYTHPFKTQAAFGAAVRIFNFADYEREFGGLFASASLDSSVAYAVQQFFLNGGSDAYVVGLKPQYRDAGPGAWHDIPQPTVTIGTIVFTALEPTDRLPMFVTISNVSGATGDLVIAYASRIETYRNVSLDATSSDFIETRLANSTLVQVTAGGGGYGSSMPTASSVPVPMNYPAPGLLTTFDSADFTAVFQADTPLDKVDVFNLLVIPGVADNGIWSAALAFAERKRAFVILDPPQDAAADASSSPLPTIGDEMDAIVPKSQNGAIYFPYLLTQDALTGSVVELPPSSYVAGVYARTDNDRGVWKAPAGLATTLLNTTGVVHRGRLTDPRQGVLNLKGVNCLRTFPAEGTVVFGARTLVSANPAFEQWKYIPVRRMALFIEQSLYASLGWAVFEPNDEPLWTALRTTVGDFMISLFNQGAFQGETPSQAFRVQCDSTTTTQYDIDQGVVNIVVAFRPLKPAEFVVIKIAQLAGQVQS
jgi:uncharacterized protein